MKNTEFDRRTVMTAAAWSVPVVAVAVATPLASASTEPATPSQYFAGTPATLLVGSQDTSPATALYAEGPSSLYIQAGPGGLDTEVTFLVSRSDSAPGEAPALFLSGFTLVGQGALPTNWTNMDIGGGVTSSRMTVVLGANELGRIDFTFYYKDTPAATFAPLATWQVQVQTVWLSDVTTTVEATTELTSGYAIGVSPT
ncbi:hypothetical protein N1031_15540 [Herbiconiux moechotypicola]|uniref:Uncharacterized protein n=1 Tax=Herbiconiux moechotypicola TaxID=637393 RepID=A0ABP5QVM7_9MICO|nr:hypothetical protein [Herbiconiux moechotypicola]MCS5731178.1 hypothetical protein [Herbiconiux moechotypicola]